MVRSEERPLKTVRSRLRRDLLAIVEAGIGSVDAAALLRSAIGRTAPWADDRTGKPVDLVAAGKAAAPMALAAAELLGGQLRRGVVTAVRPDDLAPGAEERLAWIAAPHPLPDERSVRGGRQALDVARTRGDRGGLLVLLSGGASSMLAAPADGVSLAAKVEVSRALLAAGAAIADLNTVRKHLSGVKGGWLAAAAAGPVWAYAVSDVVTPTEGDPSVIGSGPTVADPTTFACALRVLERHGLRAATPAAVLDRLQAGERGARPETPKPGDPRLARSSVTIVGTRHDAMLGAARAAERRGYRAVTLGEPVIGEARAAAGALARRLTRLAASADCRTCLVSSGETTVRVIGSGRGGRNQEFALALVRPLAGLGTAGAVASVGTDGVDGPTDAAGACVDGSTLERARDLGLADPEVYLDRNDSNAYFADLGDLVVTGPTATNVGDLQVALLDPAPRA